MARFLGRVVSERGYEVHRLGHRTVEVDCNGWDLGITVRALVNADNEDEFAISITKGSNSGIVKETILVNKNTLSIRNERNIEIFCKERNVYE